MERLVGGFYEPSDFGSAIAYDYRARIVADKPFIYHADIHAYDVATL